MKILFFHRWVGVHGGGTETHLKQLAQRFAQNGHQVAILTRAGHEKLAFPKIKVYRISQNIGECDHSYTNWRLYWHTVLFMVKSFFKLLFLWLKGIKFDVISVHFATEAIVARIFRFFTGTPYIFILEGYTLWEAKEAKLANGAVAISNYEAERCLKEVGFKPTVIYIGVDQKHFSPSSNIWQNLLKICPKGYKIIVSVCRLEPRKDLTTLLLAAKILQDKKKKYFFALAGTGIDEKNLKFKTKNLKLDNVNFLGFVADKDLPALYKTANLFILPTLEEGFGIALIEAMATGVPVISNHVGAVPEVAGEAVKLLAPKNPQLLASTIEQILTSKNLQLEMGAKGLKLVKNRYNWDNIIKHYEKAYQKTIR